MMKNRDTTSNPYRVPRQPTARWIKVSIVGLFLSNVALIGGVVFLVFSTEQCTRTCRQKGEALQESETKAAPNTEAMSKDGAESPIILQERSIREVISRVNDVEKIVSGVNSRIVKLDEFCRRSKAMDATKTTNVAVAAPDSLTPRQTSVLEMMTKMDIKISNVGIQLKEHIANSRQLCKKGHYRYGMYCFYVGEAKLSQENAKEFCSNDYGAKGTLAMIKDKFVHDFISGKLPNRQHSYWIGIEKQEQRSSDLRTSHIIRESKIETVGSDMVPSPLASSPDENAPFGSSASGSSPFDYIDGTKVQNKVWQMWGSRANRHNTGNRACAALTFDLNAGSNGDWRWQDYDCGAGLGYVCQYYVLSIGM
ncbi:uncharacterized protein LOC120339036 [Styela clava]|uniref:uncharacterized protein LOC120339036 n=1 Tax=Styela clava TaxID=7725 RepID=UPI00193A0C1B|nr:uncharacterized protein LOC120339036 [Styela clava]XP_039263023.1 uncharacterized protein LOC120339036 [Styela clava]